MIDAGRRAKAEAFARVVTGDPVLLEGLECLIEGLEWVAFQKWRASGPEAWREVAGELAALRQFAGKLKAAGAPAAGDDNGTSGKPGKPGGGG